MIDRVVLIAGPDTTSTAKSCAEMECSYGTQAVDGCDFDLVGPWVAEAQGAAITPDGYGVDAQPVGQHLQVDRGRKQDAHQTQSQGQLAGPCTSAVPYVHGHVVVVPTRADEECRPQVAHNLEAELVRVEVSGGRNIADRQVHMSDFRRTPLAALER